MNLYDDQFSESHDFPRVEKPSKVLVIASTGRCGSHMLGHALYETGKFGFPLEYANPDNLSEWKRRLGIDDVREVLAEIQRRRTSPNGVFGIKIHYLHIQELGGFDGLTALFPEARYVLLSRKDVLRQAVSLALAIQTGVWIAGQKPFNENPEYDHAQIDKCLRDTIRDNASWRYLLSASGCVYREMDFDQVRKDLGASIQEIAGFLGVEVDPGDIPEGLVTERQSSGRNAEWAERFTAEFDRSSTLLRSREVGGIDRIKGRIKRIIGA